jgi:hypothetical protein
MPLQLVKPPMASCATEKLVDRMGGPHNEITTSCKVTLCAALRWDAYRPPSPLHPLSSSADAALLDSPSTLFRLVLRRHSFGPSEEIDGRWTGRSASIGAVAVVTSKTPQWAEAGGVKSTLRKKA